MSMPNSLFLQEELMLLALRDEEGTIASAGGMYHYAIGGAIVAELLLRNRIEVEQSKKQLVNLVNSNPVGDPVIDECIERIAGRKKRASLQTWVSNFVGIKNLKHRVAKGLCERGILQAAEDRVLLIFSRKTYPELNPEPERALVERLRCAIFTDSEDVDSRTVVLISLASGTSMLNAVFDRKELKRRKARIEQIISGEATGQAAKQAIEAMQAVIFMSTITTTTVIQ